MQQFHTFPPFTIPAPSHLPYNPFFSPSLTLLASSFTAPTTNLLSTHFNPSSITSTGKLPKTTATHSCRFSGVIWNNPCKNGVYNNIKCSAMLKVMA